MQNAQPTTNCATWILKVDYLSISKQPKKFGVSEMQGSGTGNLTITCIHSRNALGCEYGRRETLVQCCSNAGPSSSIAASVWRLVAAYRAHVYSP